MLQVQKIWAKNEHGIRDDVRNLLNQRFSIDTIGTRLTENSVATKETNPDWKQKIDDGVGNPVEETEDLDTENSLSSSPQLECNSIWDTPKSCKRTSDQTFENYTTTDDVHYNDVESRVANSAITADSGSVSDESASEYIAPPQSPSIQKKFSISLGKFNIPSVQLLGDDGNIDKDKVRDVISKCMLHDVSYSCPLSFYGGIRSNIEFLVAYAKCRYGSHAQSFKFDVTDFKTRLSTIYIRATECGEIVHEGPKIHCTLKGKARVEVKAQLMKVAPRILQLDTARKIDPEIADDGHMQELMRLSTYQKAKSEENCKNDKILRSNDLSDLFQRHVLDGECRDPYIRHAGLPLYVHMYSEEQLDVVCQEDIIVHFDATGNVVRKPRDVRCKRLMYYAMVINKDGSVIPIAEMVSSEHDVASISTFLKRYRYFLTTKHISWPLFRVVVVDWSWALINSVMIEWNGMTVTNYLKQAYTYLTKETYPSFDFIVVHSCCAHFQKRVSTNMHKKFTKNLHAKNLILECVGLMIHCRTIDALDQVFERFMTVLLTTDREEAQRNVVLLHDLHHLIKDAETPSKIVGDDDPVEAVSGDGLEGRVYADSPFFHRYYAKLLSVKGDVIDTENDNEYFAPEVADYVTQSLMPFVPMWSALLLKHVVPDRARLSNANVECYFNLVKRDVLEGKVNLKIGRFIDKVKNYKSFLCAEAAINTPLKGRRPKAKVVKRLSCKRTRLSAKLDSPSHSLVQEMWQRKRKAQYSHLEGRLLGKITKKVEISNFRTSTPKQVNHDQSLLNRSDSSTHANALSNGLFMDVAYYMLELNNTEFTIGRYSSSACAPIIGFDNFDLFSGQYQTLGEKKDLDGAVIDAYTVTTLDFAKNVVYVPTTYTHYLLGGDRDKDKPETFRMYHVGDAFQGKILMPYVYDNHWCILLADIDAQTVMHLDPMFKRGNRTQSAVQYFRKYIKECAERQPNVLCDINWTIVSYKGERPLQKDTFNCGVYITYYMQCLAMGIEMDADFDSNTYRVEIAESLLRLSHDMKEVCQYCFGTRPNDLIMCNTCRRWAHLKCLNLLGIQKTLKEWNEPTSSYRCGLCANGIRAWMRY